MKNRKAFTYIEVLITLAIIAVLFIPIMHLFSHVLQSSTVTQELITAANLAKWEMERIKNLNLTEKGLGELGSAIYPPAGKEPLELNNVKWRIEKEIIKDSDPLEVRVHVFRDGEPTARIVTLVTLIEDTFWEELKPVK
ncbi:MAG: prepilin-type N-terminal cleavage/methylation domain-containing protein [Candidatus Omnitrophica bacterium]|nr:prepilin-type N-terminal cleavage/methylation domain-containing protein [Candidatus Omnitrophota bacterium]